MRLIDADELIEHVWRDRLDSRERIADLVKSMPSAQPEKDCDTCKHGYFGGACCNNCKVRFPSRYERRTDE